MSKNSLIIFGATILIILLVGGLIFLLVPRIGELSLFSASSQGSSRLPAGTVQAKVIQIIEEGEITLEETPQPYQILLVQLLEGPFAGRQVIIDYGQRQVRPEAFTSCLERRSWLPSVSNQMDKSRLILLISSGRDRCSC